MKTEIVGNARKILIAREIIFKDNIYTTNTTLCRPTLISIYPYV